MLNYLWAAMIVIGILYGAFTGNMEAVSDAALSSAKDAVSLCITMLGVMGVWVGLMEIAEKSGLIAGLTRKMQLFIHFLFPNIPKEHPANGYITTNVIANMLGLGWAATPAGLQAMEALSQLEEERGNLEYIGVTEQSQNKRGLVSKNPSGRTASKEMCDFLILNISSLQLIPVTIIAYRSQYGSVNPSAVIVPGLVATTIGTVVAIVFCKMMREKR